MKNWKMLCIVALLSQSQSQSLWAADVTALLQWSQRVELSPPVSGVVQVVQADVGDQVKKDQILLSLGSITYQAKVAENQAAMSRYSKEMAEAKRDLERTNELYERTVIATVELDQAKLRHARVQALFTEAQARLKQSQKELDDTNLRAPFDAVVVARQVEPGQTVAARLQPQTLLVLARSGEMLARARLSDAQISPLKVGQAVTVVVGNQHYPGKIKVLGLEPANEKLGSTYPVDVIFSPKEQLRAGMAATLKLP